MWRMRALWAAHGQLLTRRVPSTAICLRDSSRQGPGTGVAYLGALS
jgi:hypothetical protein